MGIDIHLIANFAALALITLAGPAVIFILCYRRGALSAPLTLRGPGPSRPLAAGHARRGAPH